MTSLSDILNLPAGTVITYKRYNINRLGQKTVLQDLERHILERVITPEDKLDIETLHMYYGTELTSQDYMQLSQVNTYRLVLYVTDDGGNQYYTVVNVDQYFLSTGYITVDYSLSATQMPSHMGLGIYGTKVKFDE